MMMVYIAAPWVCRDQARDAARLVREAGFGITHDWWDHEAGDHDYAELRRLARLDVKGVLDADYMLLLNYEKSEGKSVEQGIALMSDTPIVAVGPHPTNIFQNLPDYVWVNSVEEAIAQF